MLFDRLMKRTSFQTRLLFGLVLWIGIILCGVVSTHAQTRAIKPVRIEAKTAQNETVSYIYAESHALVIGVSQYRNGWSNLPGVQEDVEEVSQSLAKNGFQVTTIEDPGLDELENAIEDFIFEKGTNPENRLLIYYAGHGHTMTLGYGGEMGFLVPADAPVPQKGRDAKFRRQALSMQRIEEVAKNSSAKHVLFMFDACFAGSVFLATRAAPAYIQQNTKEPVRQFITSGSAEQEVPDKSIFRRAFVDALDGKADYDQDGYLTGTELGAYIQKRTAEDWEGRLTPQYGKLQDPNLNKGDFVFELSKPEVVKPPPAEPAPVAPPPDLAAQAWSMIENSENPAIFSAFIEKFPDAPQRQLAELKLMLLPSPSAEPKQEDAAVQSSSQPAPSVPDPQPIEPVSPSAEQLTVSSNSSGSNKRYSWTAEIIEDKEKKLIWQRVDAGQKTLYGAKRYCSQLKIDGWSDWRLPDPNELSQLLIGENTTEVFGELSQGMYWSSTALGARVEFLNPWDGIGNTASVTNFGEAHYTLCVRNTAAILEDSSTVNLYSSLPSSETSSDTSIVGDKETAAAERYHWTDQVAEDKREKLIWQRKDAGERTFSGAQLYCNTLDLSGFGWRLPEISELENLFEGASFRSKTKTEIFRQLSFGSYWSTSKTGSETRLHNPWNGSGAAISAEELFITRHYTVCVKNSTLENPNNPGTVHFDSWSGLQSKDKKKDYQITKESSTEVIGCGFMVFGCADEPLGFPEYEPDFHIKGYRRINLWGKDRPWTNTKLEVQSGDQVYFFGTGEVTTCPLAKCSEGGAKNLSSSSISYVVDAEYSFGSQIDMLGSFFSFQREAHLKTLSIKNGGVLKLAVKDGDLTTISTSNYNDNSGVYILDIFVIDPEQAEGFNRFKDALFEANPNDANVKAYLGLR